MLCPTHGGGVYGRPDGVDGGDVDRGPQVRRGLGHGEQQREGDGEHRGAAAQGRGGRGPGGGLESVHSAVPHRPC